MPVLILRLLHPRSEPAATLAHPPGSRSVHVLGRHSGRPGESIAQNRTAVNQRHGLVEQHLERHSARTFVLLGGNGLGMGATSLSYSRRAQRQSPRQDRWTGAISVVGPPSLCYTALLVLSVSGHRSGFQSARPGARRTADLSGGGMRTPAPYPDGRPSAQQSIWAAVHTTVVEEGASGANAPGQDRVGPPSAG